MTYIEECKMIKQNKKELCSYYKFIITNKYLFSSDMYCCLMIKVSDHMCQLSGEKTQHKKYEKKIK
jgi:hypothetical protein